MGFFSNLFHKGGSKGGPKAAVPGSQPHRDWPWTLNLSGYPSSQISWDIIAAELRELNLEDVDSFLILEQKDPQNDKNYWYIQSAIALKGPDQGKYIAGIGFPGETGPVLMERCFEELNEVIQLFETAYDRQPLELSGFENFFD